MTSIAPYAPGDTTEAATGRRLYAPALLAALLLAGAVCLTEPRLLPAAVAVFGGLAWSFWAAPRYRALSLPAVFALAGAVSVWQPLVALGIVAILLCLLRGEGLVRDAFALILIGNVVLNYGFANIGISLGGLPLPFTDLVLIGLAGWVLLHRRDIDQFGASGFFLAGILGFALLRLFIDLPRYGTLAVRDFTTPLEASTVLVGFWLFNRYGLDWSRRLWLATSLCVLAYCLLFPLRDQLVAMSPFVGLQQPVPLVGNYSGSGPAVLAALFFFLLLLRPPLSVLLGALGLILVAYFQSRGLYLVLPIACLVAVLASGGIKTRLPSRLAASAILCLVLLVVVLPLGPQGRLGPVTAGLVGTQIGTLFGQEGPGAGSYEDRLEWLDQTWAAQSETLGGPIWGVGLGPDLTGGASGGPESIRKPHNDYLEIFGRFGAIGVILWAGFFVSLLRPICRGLRSTALSAAERSFLLWLLTTSVAYMLVSATQPQLAFPYGTLPLFTLLGMGLALVTSSRRAASTAPTDEALAL
jgi:O-antigen ligase